MNLRDFLLHRHAAKQVFDAFLNRLAGILIKRALLGRRFETARACVDALRLSGPAAATVVSVPSVRRYSPNSSAFAVARSAAALGGWRLPQVLIRKTCRGTLRVRHPLRHALESSLQLGDFSRRLTCAAGRADRHHECDQREDGDEENHAAHSFHVIGRGYRVNEKRRPRIGRRSTNAA